MATPKSVKRQKRETSTDSKILIQNNSFIVAIEKGKIKDINVYRNYSKTVLDSLPLDPLRVAVTTCNLHVVNTVISVLTHHGIRSIGTEQKIPNNSMIYTFQPRTLAQLESDKCVYHSYMSACLAIELDLCEILNSIMCFYSPSHVVFVDLFQRSMTSDNNQMSTIILDNINPLCHNDILKQAITKNDISMVKFLVGYGVSVDTKNMALALNVKNEALINVLLGLPENVKSFEIANKFSTILNS